MGAYRSDVFDELGYGMAFVAEDRHDQHYGNGQRAAQWARLRHKTSGKTIFFMNHHGPTPVGTGGNCGDNSATVTAYNLLKVIADNAMVGDSVIFVGDFNAPWLYFNKNDNQYHWFEEVGRLSCHIPHIFSDDADDDMNGIDNFFSSCTKVVEKTIMPKAGSDHHALNVIFELQGTAFEATPLTNISVIV